MPPGEEPRHDLIVGWLNAFSDLIKSMKLTKHYVITLSLQEAYALNILLGNRSQETDIKNGLTVEESVMISNLYDNLPNREDDEDDES